MKLGARIFLSYMVILTVCFWYPLTWVRDSLRTRYLEGLEDPLVDQANILAALAGVQIENSAFDPAAWTAAFDQVHRREPAAQIYDYLKTRVDMEIYITDSSGRVIFSSGNPAELGRDYSSWRDVRLTMEGQYGARTTWQDPTDSTSAVLYVAAPIRVDGRNAGVLTVAKPTTAINDFLVEAKPNIFKIGVLSALVATVLSLLTTLWFTRSIKQLTRYAEGVGRGMRVTFPRLDSTEIGEMGKAFERMQEALEGKKYVERYVQNLTHEVKSPLSAIRGATELMEERDMDPQRRSRFLANIRDEAGRIQNIVDRMLALSSLEAQTILQKNEKVLLRPLISTVLESFQPHLSRRNITAEVEAGPKLAVQGDAFLLHQAVNNLVANAIEFSPPSSRIDIRAVADGKGAELSVQDQGAGIPDYALNRIFDKFYSLPRPGGQKKSTGLGLNFVKQIAVLHGGDVEIINQRPRGVRATIRLSAAG